MKGKKNIFEFHRDNYERVTFVVRRDYWSRYYGLLVTSVLPEQIPTGLYGKAYGFSLPSLTGKGSSSYWGIPGKPKSISCAGCYQWLFLEDKELPSAWKRYISEFLSMSV
jgi:hypothetical protein